MKTLRNASRLTASRGHDRDLCRASHVRDRASHVHASCVHAIPGHVRGTQSDDSARALHSSESHAPQPRAS
jgi:hypothetical protein